VWQALREQLHPKGVELVTVGLDTLGDAGCRAFIEAAAPNHPSLLDRQHVMAEQFGVINIPSSLWIDEDGIIVRPAEVAPAPPRDTPRELPELPEGMPARLTSIMQEASQIRDDSAVYHAALLDWVEKGAASEFAMSPETVIERSRPRNPTIAEGHAHFEIASHLELNGNHEAAKTHFRAAHTRVPDSWTFRRQAWSLEADETTPMGRFWQGPAMGDEASWPYEGDWLKDIQAVGAENYNDPWKP